MEDVSTPLATQANSTLPTAPLLSIAPQALHPSVPIPSSQAASLSSTVDMQSEMVNKLSLLDQIVTSAQEAKNALLRGQEVEVSANLGHLSNHLETASELGVGPAPTPRENTPSSAVPSPITTFHGSPAQMSPNNATTVTPGLLPSLPVDQPSKRPSMPKLRVEPEYGQTLTAPPLVHSHSFPNGHQLPSQVQGVNGPTPMASPSFINAIGIQHAPLISSPLATMPVSRPPSPPASFTGATSELMDLKADLDLRPDIRADGRPIIARTRSTSILRKQGLTGMTASVPPSAWQSRHGSPVDDDDDEDSDDEGPKRQKRRRSSADANDLIAQAAGAFISEDIRRQLDQIFHDFLNRVCSDRKSSLLFGLA
jgi:hypothetical protein